jgi:hypothetical protein
MSIFERLSVNEVDVITRCLQASVDGPYFDDWEFSTLMGMERNEMRTVLEAWPNPVDSDKQSVAVNNALVNLRGYPHGRKLPVPADELEAVFLAVQRCRRAAP